MIHGEEPLLGAIDAIYAASVEPDRWREAMCAISGLFDACAATLLQSTSTGIGAVFASIGIDEEALKLYDQHYVAIDPAVKAAAQLPIGAWASTDDLFSPSDYTREEMVADLMLPNGLYRVAGSVLVRTRSEYASLGLHRPKHHREFDRHDQRIYLTIQPHLQRALAVARRIRRANFESEILTESFDHLRTGVVLLDASGRITFANRTAREIAAAGDGLNLRRDGPTGSRSDDTANLRQEIREVLSINGSGSTGQTPSAVLLDRPSGKRALEVIVAPIGNGSSRQDLGLARVALYISDPVRLVAPPAEWLRQLYGLTDAETAVALMLANGSNLTESAEFLGVTRNTVRTHLQRILQKTDVRRQGELIRLVLGGPVGLVEPG